MTKAELVSHLASNCDLSKSVVESVLNELASAARDTLKNGDEVTLPDIGKLKVADRPARTGRNPGTGETIQIAASRKLKFVPAKSLKEAVA